MTLRELEDHLRYWRERGAHDNTLVFLRPFPMPHGHDGDALARVRMLQAPDEEPELVLYAKEE